jgi:hypothetical protein
MFTLSNLSSLNLVSVTRNEPGFRQDAHSRSSPGPETSDRGLCSESCRKLQIPDDSTMETTGSRKIGPAVETRVQKQRGN